MPEEPVLRAPLLRTFSPASAVSLVRNKPAAEGEELQKKKEEEEASGEMLRRWLVVWDRCVSGVYSACSSASGSASGCD